MKILVGCEFSGVVREAFRNCGHDAWSCDLLPSEDHSDFHIQGDVLEVISDGWDIGIFFPPCTYICSSGLHWCNKREGRIKMRDRALEFVNKLMKADIEHIAIENPIGCISTYIRRPDQIINPYEYGEDASKKTCLWLKNLPKLKPGKFIQPRVINGKRIWANQTPTGQNKLSSRRSKERSITFTGIAKAMALQWGL